MPPGGLQSGPPGMMQSGGMPPGPGMMPPGMMPPGPGMMPSGPGMMPPGPGGMPPGPGGMPPGPGGMPRPNYPGQGPPQGQGGYPQGPGMSAPARKSLDPDSMPNPIQVMEDDEHNHSSGEFVTDAKGKVPPLVTTRFLTRDQGNSGPNLIRSTMYSVPDSPDMKKQTGVPFGLA